MSKPKVGRIPSHAATATLEGRACRIWHDGANLHIRFTDKRKPRGYVLAGAYIQDIEMPASMGEGIVTERLRIDYATGEVEKL